MLFQNNETSLRTTITVNHDKKNATDASISLSRNQKE